MNVSGSLPIPTELLCLILSFEGGAIIDFQLDYIGSIYIGVYRQAFGWQAGPYPCTNTPREVSAKLSLYMQLAEHIHSKKQKSNIKIRKSRKFFLPWRKAFKDEMSGILPIIQKEAFKPRDTDKWHKWPNNIIDLMVLTTH